MENRKLSLANIIELLDGKVICNNSDLTRTVSYGFASDLLSDVLTLDRTDILFLTGLCNTQTIRTAEMADINQIVFVRGKIVTPEMCKIARENNIVLIQSPMSMFRASGILYSAGLNPVY
jgi:serine kinase of HPr protein (carbohydrate metabolism regulator)